MIIAFHSRTCTEFFHVNTGRKGNAVTLVEKKRTKPDLDTISTSELMSAVLDLSTCIENALPTTQPNVSASCLAAIDTAQAAVRQTEANLSDCMERITALEQLAITDELTGILNRRGFLSEFRRTLSSASRYSEQGILVYIDLDDFKPINDTYGHAAGDEVLRQVTTILLESVRDTDIVARLGGDEFAVLLTRTKWEDGITRVMQIDQSLNQSVVTWKKATIHLSASIGTQIFGPKDHEEELLSLADNAMYEVKKSRHTLPARHATA
jgi:diguanylate cyclase (GGDEF)-like protein